jgi:hypothetical protein
VCFLWGMTVICIQKVKRLSTVRCKTYHALSRYVCYLHCDTHMFHAPSGCVWCLHCDTRMFYAPSGRVWCLYCDTHMFHAPSWCVGLYPVWHSYVPCSVMVCQPVSSVTVKCSTLRLGVSTASSVTLTCSMLRHGVSACLWLPTHCTGRAIQFSNVCCKRNSLQSLDHPAAQMNDFIRLVTSVATSA